MSFDPITFGLAFVGYALLATDVVRRREGRRTLAVTGLAACVIVAHVICVWAFRFEWSFTDMWSKSRFGFVIFHSALLLIVGSLAAREPWRTRLVYVAFVIVSSGAVPAPLRYPEIAVLAIPMFAVFTLAIGLALRPVRRR